MKLHKLNFFASRPTYKERPFKVKQGIQPEDRDFLSFIYEHKPIIINGLKYEPRHIFARASKKTIGTEMIICFFIWMIFLNQLSDQLPEIYLLLVVPFFLIGALIGVWRIEKQKNLADKFNNS